jgi:hypothetical protein
MSHRVGSMVMRKVEKRNERPNHSRVDHDIYPNAENSYAKFQAA